jgi:hypothetical protein
MANSVTFSSTLVFMDRNTREPDVIHVINIALPYAFSTVQPPELRTVNVEAIVPDPHSPGKRRLYTGRLRKSGSAPVESLTAAFVAQYSELRGIKFRVLFNHRFYEGLTLDQCGIQPDSHVDLVAHEANKRAAEIEGLQFISWSLVPLMFAAAFIFAGFFGKFSYVVRGAFVLVGTVLAVPGMAMCSLGLFERYPERMKAAIVGDYWFSPRCCVRPEKEIIEEAPPQPYIPLATCQDV